MKHKIIFFFFVVSLTFPSIVSGEYKISRNHLKLTDTISNNTENIEIKNTDLTNENNIKNLANDLEKRKNYKKNEIKIISVPKSKGAQEIYNVYANSVVLIGNPNDGYSYGSGFFIEHNGLKIITNWHVVEKTKRVDVWLKPAEEFTKKKEVEYLILNGDSYKGKVVKINKKKDLAMIEIKGISHRIKTINFGSFKKVKIGEMGFAIGHPKGNSWSITGDMVSQIRPDYVWRYKGSRHNASVIQIQTPLHQGNSGGPLFNKKMELIGVNTFTTEKSQSLNFAVSVDDLKVFINEAQQEEIESQYIKKKKKDPTWIKKKKKSQDKKSTSNKISKKYPNAQKKDINNNGIIDAWLVDKNNNGLIDMVVLDLNENEIIDSIGYDENENDNCEVILFDDDEDGNPDRADIDEDDNGTSDIMAYDYNQDGEWDKFEKVS